MLHLLRSCSRASSQILNISPSVARVPVRKKSDTPHILRTPLQNGLPFFMRPWLLTAGLGSENGDKGYHTSKCCFKKKKVFVVPKRPPIILTYLPNTPKPALYVALTGLIPFVAPPLFMMMRETYIPELAFAQMAYGASFLSFLGGVRWGFTLPEDSPAKPDLMNLACSGAPLVFSWYAFLISEGLPGAIVMVIMGFGVALHNEVFLLPHYPNWFKALRIVVTLVAFFSFVATLILKNVYLETDLKQPAQAE
ncbi:transmembrane protein 69 [Monodelphis domestica]|uniref:Transmembrane protein 69 n=1 Tax=Monodelphis domestica TaxID=13616 RepID=A0A5F8G4T7_MONDO|nr:transmembrane protein 69 [Monodelphis domestica]